MAILFISAAGFFSDPIVVIVLLIAAFAAGALMSALFGQQIEEEVEAAYTEVRAEEKAITADVAAEVAKAKEEVIAHFDTLLNRYLGAIHPLRQEFLKLRVRLLSPQHKPFEITKE